MERKILLLLSAIFIAALFPFNLSAQSGQVSTFAGIPNSRGTTNGDRLESQFYGPSGAAFDSKSNLYVVEHTYGTLRKINTDGAVTVFAGIVNAQSSIDGVGLQAGFHGPSDVIITEKDTLFVTDQLGNKIRRVDLAGNVVTLAGSVYGFRDAQGSQAQFRSPSDMALGSDGNIYVADQGNHRIRMVDREGNVTTILGDGTSQTRLGAMNQAVVADPRFIDFDKDGNLLIASQYDLYKLDLTNEELTHIMGQGTRFRYLDGDKTTAHFKGIKDLYVSPDGVIYIGDDRVLRQLTDSGYLVTVSGHIDTYGFENGDLGIAKYQNLGGLVQKGRDSLFIVDQGHHVVRLARIEKGVSLKNGNISSDVTWTKANSPHVIVSDITVENGAKLTIEPGAMVRRNLEYGVTVKGRLSAVGVESDSIHFSDGYGSSSLTRKFFVTFEETNLSQSELAFISAKSQSNGLALFLRVGNEVSTGNTATVPISGSLNLTNSLLYREYLLSDSKSSGAEIKLTDSRLKVATFHVLGKESVEVDNVLFTDSELKNDERLTVKNSVFENSRLVQKSSNIGGSTISEFQVVNSTLNETAIVGNAFSDFQISDSELTNSPIYIPSGNVKITDVRNTLNRQYYNIKKINNQFEYFSHFIMAGSAQISGLFLNTNNNKSGVYITGENSRNPTSSLTASTLRGDRSEGLLQYKQENDLTITSTNFISTNRLINNFSSKKINASGNYFKGLLDSAAIEQEVYHIADNSVYGLVDFSNPSVNRFFGAFLLGPEVKFGRLYGNDYLDNVAIRFNSVDPKTEKLLVYKHDSYRPENLTFLAEVTAPFLPLTTPYEANVSYAVIAEDENGEQAEAEYASNKHLTIQVSGAQLTIDEDEEVEFQIKVIADPIDSVAVSVSKNTNEDLISNDDINISFLKEDGDTTFFQVSMKPLPEAFGFTSINFRATNGLVEQIKGISQNVRKINEFKPVIEGVDPVTGLFTDRTFKIGHTSLSPFVQFSDRDGGDIYIKITSVVNGTLTRSGSEIQSSETIPYYPSSNSPLNWTPPSGQFGLIDAFKIRVYDEDFDSDEEVVIQFLVQPNTPPLIVKIDTTDRNYEDQYHNIRLSSFLRNIEFTDEQGDDLFLVVTEVVNGALWKSSQPEFGQLDLPFRLSENNTSFEWLPPPNEHGRIAAFKVKAADLTDESDVEHTVYFDVKPLNDAPSFDFVPDPAPSVALDVVQSIPLTGISPGPLEEDQTVSFVVTSSDQSRIPDNQVDVIIKEGGEGEIIYLPVAGTEGSVELLVKITDNLNRSSQQRLYLTFLQPDAPPVIAYDDSYDIYVGNSFELAPATFDDRALVSSRVISEVPSWLTVDDSLRVASLSAEKLYSRDYKDGWLREATFGSVHKMIHDKHGNVILVDGTHGTIRKISPDGLVSTIAGNREFSGYRDGPAHEARFYGISNIVYDPEIDILYIVEGGNNAIRTLDANGMVSTLFKTSDNLTYGNLRSADIDKDGNLYVANSTSRRYRIFRFDRAGNVEVFAGNGDWTGVAEEGPKEDVSVGSLDGLVVMPDGTVYVSDFGFIRKIDTNGQLFAIPLPNDFTASGSDTYLFEEDEGHLLLSRQSGEQVLRFNINDNSFEKVIGEGDLPFSEDVVALSLKLGRNSSGHSVRGLFRWNDTNLIMGMSDWDSNLFLAALRHKLDTIKGTPTADDIGTYQITVEAEDLGGKVTRKDITLNVLGNNQISATNTEQVLSFTEDAVEVDLEDIVLSGMSGQDSAIVRLTLDDKLSGRFTTNSGNGEVFIDSTGVWQIVSNQTDLNIALAALAFEPGPDYDQDFNASLYIVNAKGGVPAYGNIKFEVTPVSDASRLSVSIEDAAFVEIPYSFDIKLEDPDTELFNLSVESLPSWLSHDTGPFWVEKYAGIKQDSYQLQSLDGELETAAFNKPGIMAADNEGNLYVVEQYHVKKITLEGQVTTYFSNRSHSQDGQLPDGGLGTVSDITFDEDNNMIVADNSRRLIKKITPAGLVTTIAGSGGTGHADDDALRATFTNITGLEIDANGNIYILDNQIIRKLDNEGKITTVAGNRNYGVGEGEALDVPFFSLRDIEMDSNGDLIIADDRTIRKYDLETNTISLLLGDGRNSCCRLDGKNDEIYFKSLIDIQLDENDNIYAIADGRLFKTNLQTQETQVLGQTSYYSVNIPGYIDQAVFGGLAGIEILGGNIFLADQRYNVINRVYLKPGAIKGKPTAADLGEHTFSYKVINGREESGIINATITVYDNDFPRYKGIDSTYYYTEDQELSLKAFQLTDDAGDEFSLELKLQNKEIGALSIAGFEDSFDQLTGTWLLEGTRQEINQALLLLNYLPEQHNFDPNQVEVRSFRKGGSFALTGQLILRGVGVNDIPVLASLDDRTAVVGASDSFEVQVSDADKDPLKIEVVGLPGSFTLNTVFDTQFSTLAGTRAHYIAGEGPKDDIRLRAPDDMTLGPDGLLYFVDNLNIRVLTADSLKLYAPTPVNTQRGLTDLIFRGEQLYLADSYSIYTFAPDGTTTRIIGSTVPADTDGNGLDARFSAITEILPGPGTRDMYVLDQGAGKVKYIDDNFNVTTVFSLGDNSGVELKNPVYMTQDRAGTYYLLDSPGRVLKFTHEGTLQEMLLDPDNLFSTNFWSIFKGLQVDTAGNLILFSSNRVYLVDHEGKLHNISISVGNLLEGSGSQVNLGYINDLKLMSNGQFVFSDLSNDLIRKAVYHAEYSISGTPVEGEQGEYNVSVTADDSYLSTRVEETFKLTVEGSDLPSVSNLNQAITYTEDSGEVAVAPIVIDSEDVDMEFEISITQTPGDNGIFQSSPQDLSGIVNVPDASLRGTGAELNAILANLSFLAVPDNTAGTSITLSVKQADGALDASGVIDLSVIPVNDGPELNVSTEDTTAFVGKRIVIPVQSFDPDGNTSLAPEHDLPDWLTFRSSYITDQPIAGVPGKSGFINGEALTSRLMSPARLDVDSKGNIYLLETESYTVRKISAEGNITNFAGRGISGYKDGAGTIAEFGALADLVIDYQDNVYVSDPENFVIRKITPEGVVTTFSGSGLEGFSDGFAHEARFGLLGEMGLNSAKTALFVHDKGNRKIRMVDLLTREVTTYKFGSYDHILPGYNTRGIAISPDDKLYVKNTDVLVRADLNGDNVTFLNTAYSSTGDGTFSLRSLNTSAMVFLENGNIVTNDLGDRKLRVVAGNYLGTILGEGADGYASGYYSEIKVGHISDFASLPDGSFVLTDQANHIVRRFYFGESYLSGTPASEDIGPHLAKVAIEDSEELKAIKEVNIRVIDEESLPVTGLGQTIVYNEGVQFIDLPEIALNDPTNENIELTIGAASQAGSFGVALQSPLPYRESDEVWYATASVDSINTLLEALKFYPSEDLVTDLVTHFSFKRNSETRTTEGRLNFVYKEANKSPRYVGEDVYTVTAGEAFTIDLLATDANRDSLAFYIQEVPAFATADSVWFMQEYYDPFFSRNLDSTLEKELGVLARDMVLDAAGDVIFADDSSNQIRKLTADFEVVTLAGTGVEGLTNGPASEADFNKPYSLVYTPDSALLISDEGNRVLRMLTREGQVSTLSGSGLLGYDAGRGEGIGSHVSYLSPTAMAQDEEGNTFLVDFYAHTVRKVEPNSLSSVYTGQAWFQGYQDGPREVARFKNPSDVLIDQGKMYLSDLTSFRWINESGEIETLAGGGGSAYVDGALKDARFKSLQYLLALEPGVFLASDIGANAIRKISLTEGTVSTIAIGVKGNKLGDALNSGFGAGSLLKLPNGEVLMYDNANLRLLKLVRSTPVISGLAGQSDLGMHTITVTISDGKGGLTEHEIVLNVVSANTAPTVTTIANITETYAIDGTITVPLFDYFSDAEDADNELAYEVVTNTDNTVVTSEAVDSADGILTLNIENVGTTQLEVQATDSRGALVSTTFEVEISKAAASVTITSEETVADGGEKSVSVTTDPVDLTVLVTYNSLSDLPTEAGTYQVVATVDERNYEGEATYEFIILPANTTPVVTTIANITETYAVDGTITVPLFDYFSDAEDADSELAYEVVTNTDNTVVTSEAVDSADGILTLNIENVGTTQLEVQATDSRGASVSTTFEVEISKAAAGVIITSEETIADDGEKSVSVTTDPVDLTVLVTYNSLSDLPTEAGTYQVVAIVDERNYEGEATYEFIILPANTIPVVTTIANITETYAVDGTITVPLFDYFSDAEDADSELAYEVVTNTDNTVVTSEAVDSADGILTLNIENVGITQLEVQATDSRGASVSTTFEVEISKASAGVIITSEETIADGGEKSVSVTTDPVDLTVLVTYNSLSDLPTEAGTYQVVATVDERNYEGEATYEFIILPANTTPVVTTIANITETYAVDGTITVPLFDYFSDAEDADNELAYEVVTNTDNTVVTSEAVDSADGILTLNIENVGTTQLEVQATDSRGATVSTAFEVEISKAAAGVIITSEETIADGGEKSVSVTTDPVDLTVLVTYNSLSDLPTEAGTYQVVAIVDERNYEGEATYEFIILPANTTPVVTTIANITETYAVDGTITVPLFDYFSDAEDADNELAYEVVTNTDNTVVTSQTVDSADGILTLNAENVGTTQLEVKATDSQGASVNTTFTVSIEKATATVSITDTEFVNDGEEKAVTVATDPMGLAYTVTYDGSETAPSAIGVYEVIVNLDERNYAGTATAQLSIINVAPEDLNLSGLTVFENQQGSTVVGTLTVTDQNPADTHSYSLAAGVTDNGLFALNGATLSATEAFDFETKDQYSVTVKVEDNQGASYEEVFAISVLDINDAPGVDTADPIEIVKDLGPLSFTISGLNTGGEPGQTLTLSTSTTGVLSSASVVANADGSTATVTFESASGQEGAGNIQLTVKDDGGSANGGIDTYVIDIPVTVSPANLTVTAVDNCGPGQVTLSASGADAYSWYAGALGGEVLSTGSDFTTNLSTTTTFFVAGTFSGDESPLRVPVQASVFDLPEVPVIINNAEVLSVTEVSGATYTWFRNGTEVPDVSGASFAPTESGDYTVMISNANGCTAMSDALSVIITGLEEGQPGIEVTVYPVPSSDYIHLSFTEVMRKGTQIRLLDNSGRELTRLVMPVADTKATIDIRSFASGIHFITVQDGDKLVRKRVIIMK